jgi:hypothetical protein
MVKAVEVAQGAAKKAIEAIYDGTLTVIEHQKIKDDITKVTGYKDVVVLEGQPCKLSFERITTAVQSESAASVAQTTKLFISPSVVIKPGSKISVTQSGVTADYKSSGIPAVYPTHQEIILDLFKDWT